jgi:imidazolonepropionase
MPYLEPMTSYIDCKNAIALPGFIDSHTHLVHSGSRESEFAMKLAGMPYLDILKSGGGIHSTVALTRQASFEELYDQAKKSLDEMLLLGVTTIEAKSGYGLNLETELKQLKVIKALNANHPIELSPTYLGAHAIPKEYSDNRQSYIFEVIENMKTVAQMHLAESVDVFCENEVFSVAETEEILIAAKEMGFQVRLHADEIHSLGGAGLAVRLNAVSADHLLAIVEEDIDRLAQSETIANLLPQTAFYLNKPYANARALIDKGAAVAISSDYNPGSAPSENFQFTMQLAANKMRLSPAEVLVASTLNPAVILGRSHRIGTLEVGKQADITLLKAPNLEYVLYHFGINHTQDVYKNGRLVVKDRQFVKEEL